MEELDESLAAAALFAGNADHDQYVLALTTERAELAYSLESVLSRAESAPAIVTGALIASVAAMLLPVHQGSLSWRHMIETWVRGWKTMIPCFFLLLIAWSLGSIMSEIGTSTFIVNAIGTSIPVQLLPLAIFCICAVVAFFTGQSWASMSLFFPLAVELLIGAGAAPGDPAFSAGVAAVLSGVVMGDHSAMISDTTILAAMSTGCDLSAHVKTQMPYALTVAAIAGIIGYLPAGFGFPPLLSLVLGLGAIQLVFAFVATPTPLCTDANSRELKNKNLASVAVLGAPDSPDLADNEELSASEVSDPSTVVQDPAFDHV
eukprot:gnl/Ergobibamus_cyprinoides/1128.p1 GENE.gnl/Ergobibamus_cyprinoides/1128~~gnl/Ergobibamus_cyprinoides/1128.p1  ORF type:complete len:318 (+),score=136.99 gnl/Ergobibamus_cyprinoides/1128:535-1488(+)